MIRGEGSEKTNNKFKFLTTNDINFAPFFGHPSFDTERKDEFAETKIAATQGPDVEEALAVVRPRPGKMTSGILFTIQPALEIRMELGAAAKSEKLGQQETKSSHNSYPFSI